MKKIFLITMLSLVYLTVFSQGNHFKGEAVDLGLSVRWASCNVGATRPEGSGKYYAWGETSPKSVYMPFNSVTYKKNIGIDIAGTRYDAAHVNWGGEWRMPRYSEIKELVNRCTWKETQLNGVRGYRVTGPNGNSIFLPCSGSRYENELYNPNSYGYYWSSTARNIYSARSLTIGYTNQERDERFEGLTIRAVCPYTSSYSDKIIQNTDEEKIYDVVEKMPSFPGGVETLVEWLNSNVQYPEVAIANGIEGRVMVQFVVGKDGRVYNAKVVRGVDASLDKEAIRVIKSMPLWIPGMQNGKKVNCKFSIPVIFRLK